MGPPGTCPDAHDANARLAFRLRAHSETLSTSSIDLAGAALASRADSTGGGGGGGGGGGRGGGGGGGASTAVRPSPMAVARRLRVSASPYVVLHGYANRSVARAMRAEVIHSIRECSETGEGHDRRRLGAPAAGLPLLRAFETDPYLLSIARHHLVGARASGGAAAGTVNVKAQSGLTLAGENSGGGWHKDTIGRGIKALMYLDDVDGGNGPFAMLRHYTERQLVWSPDAVSGVRRRLNESVVLRACAAPGSQARIEELHASMGAVIVFEISSAHRGMPCKHRERASLTNYYRVRKASTVCKPERHIAEGPFMHARSAVRE